MSPQQTAASPKKRVMVVLPSPLMARNFLQTDALRLMGAGSDTDVLVVSPGEENRAHVERHHAQWHAYFHPRRSRESNNGGVWQWLLRWGRYTRYLAGLFIHMCLTYRFNTLSGFRGFATRLRQSFGLRKIYLREGLPMSHVFGFPFPRSVSIYRFLKRIYYRPWQGFGPVNKLVKEFGPDLMVMGMIQTHMVTPYAIAAERYGVKVLGLNGSWDQPTTKGPVFPNVRRILVQNSIVKEELIRYHQVRAKDLAVIGWLQMDAYALGHAPLATRHDFLQLLGVPKDDQYVLFAANAPRLGMHEPEVFAALAELVSKGELGSQVTLVFRCHPQDRNWRERWAWAVDLDHVLVQPPDLGALDHLADVIRHAAVVIASAGSINLDAVALDTPTIGLAWETENMPSCDRPARAYDLEHLSDLRQASGMMFAHDMSTLVHACKRYLGNRAADATGRAEVREKYLFQLDGKAASRLAREVAEMLE